MSLTWNPQRSGNIANAVCTAVLVFAVIYFFGHIVAAWLRGSFGGWR